MKKALLALGAVLIVGALWAWNRFSPQYEESAGPIRVSPVKPQVQSDPDDFVTLVFVLHNLDTRAHSYQLTPTVPQGWLALEISHAMELAPNTQQEIFLTVQVPPATPAGRYDVALKAQSDTLWARGRTQIEVRSKERLKLSLLTADLVVRPDEEKILKFTVTNRGNVSAGVALAVTAAPVGWQSRLRESSLTLPPNQSKSVELSVKPLPEAPLAPARFTIQALSSHARDELSLTVALSPKP